MFLREFQSVGETITETIRRGLLAVRMSEMVENE